MSFIILLLAYHDLTMVKGIGHLKIHILSSFTRPQVVQNLFEFLSDAQNKIFLPMWVTKQFLVPIDFHYIYKLIVILWKSVEYNSSV